MRIAIAFFLVTSQSIFCQGLIVSGKVVDQKGAPLLGVTVQLLPEDNYTSTDDSGHFRLTVNIWFIRASISKEDSDFIGHKTLNTHESF